MNGERRVSRYLLPLVIVLALVWLALQTLGDSSSSERFLFSDALALTRQHASRIERVTFHPSSQKVDFRLVGGDRRTTVYPVDQSAYELQQLLEEKNVAFEAKSTGSSAWWSILTSLLPFVLLFGFWIFLMQRVKSGQLGGSTGPSRPST